MFLIFYLPASVFGIPTAYIILHTIGITLPEPIFTPNDLIWSTLAFTIPLGLGVFGTGLAIAFAIWYGYAGRIRDFLRDAKRGQVDEKIAVIIGHALRYRNISAQKTSTEIRNLYLRRLNSDIRSIGRIKDSVGISQREDLDRAIRDLIATMRNSGFNEDADDVDRVFRLWLN